MSFDILTYALAKKSGGGGGGSGQGLPLIIDFEFDGELHLTDSRYTTRSEVMNAIRAAEADKKDIYLKIATGDSNAPTNLILHKRVVVGEDAAFEFVTLLDDMSISVLLTEGEFELNVNNLQHKYSAGQITLYADEWNDDKEQTVEYEDVTPLSLIQVAPSPVHTKEYAAAGIVCVDQGYNELTFKCENVPTESIDVNVVNWGD